ncbi:hypothetical protein VE03_06561, partial [Pseudogymnoascus sp. 23342-1-I1]
MRSAAALLVLGHSFVRSAAANLNNTEEAWVPVIDDDDSPFPYYPDQHDCPLPCIDYSNMHSWISYNTVKRLKRCQEPMLLQISVTHPLDDPATSILIRACTLGSGPAAKSIAAAPENSTATVPIENPKKADNIFEPSLDVAPACVVNGEAAQVNLDLSISSTGSKVKSADITTMLEGVRKFFNSQDSCDENVLFAYNKQTVASIYIGAGLGKLTVDSASNALATHLQTSSIVSNQTIAQLCGSGRGPERVFGISIDTTGNLVGVQKTALGWSKGNCDANTDLKSAGKLAIKVFNIAKAPIASANSTLARNRTSTTMRRRTRESFNLLDKRATCRYIQVYAGDGCPSLVTRCGITSAAFTLYNNIPNLCSTFQEGDFVCCSAGDRYTKPKPVPPKPNADGTCATYLIQSKDECFVLAETFGVTVNDLENFNKGKVWAWTNCEGMLYGYNMCISEGRAPLPPPQAGTECGSLVPGTVAPVDSSVSLASLNPCPLKACCSNWGYCGVFPSHCDIHAPPGGGPGSKSPGSQNTCVSNCAMNIQKNSSPPTTYSRIGYYESWNLERDCLWLKAKNANTDGTYTHIHWGFLGINPSTFKPIIIDPMSQWDDFKSLTGVKRIASFGGWAYSTEPATYNIVRSAIINNRETFVANIVEFVKDESIDGIDIDWEYPGAPDILVGGQPIGKKTDGAFYYLFLKSLKEKIATGKSVSIPAPASYWYLKGFPIAQIATIIDYIVYKTYDLHGQWDYGNVNAFDECPSGKCVRSHVVNLTETVNTLAIITKAGVANNKIFVGEASYGRSFHLAQASCWGPMCEFTGSRNQSDATPGRCTKTAGYISYAEINEIFRLDNSARQLRDDSNTDVLLYKGDYVSYMTPSTKNVRRDLWKALNFAGTIDWAVDLQAFRDEDKDEPPDRPEEGKGCISGRDDTVNSADLCQFACAYGFCPESLCTCLEYDTLEPYPIEIPNINVKAWDESDVDINRLCKFSCKYGYCPGDTCEVIETVINWRDGFDYGDPQYLNLDKCLIYRDGRANDYTDTCKKYCQPILDAAEPGSTTNYGCSGFVEASKVIPWTSNVSPKGSIPGECICNNWLLNEIADFVLEALPLIAQFACKLLMSVFHIVLDIGSYLIPPLRIIETGLDALTMAAQMLDYIYSEGESPAEAFDWWLSPCGPNILPDDVNKVFEILSQVSLSKSSYKQPKNIAKGSGRKGDKGNPKSPSKPRPTTTSGGGSTSNGPSRTPSCKIKPGESTTRVMAPRHTLRIQSCVADTTHRTEWVVTSAIYHANPTTLTIKGECDKQNPQACYHYSSVIRNRPIWSTLTSPPEAATTAYRNDGFATATWEKIHNGGDPYLMGPNDPAYLQGGKDTTGQVIRYLPGTQNGRAAKMWQSSCFSPVIKALSNDDLRKAVENANAKDRVVQVLGETTITQAVITVINRPIFTITAWGNTPAIDDGLQINPCWPKKKTPNDPGFQLLDIDQYNVNNPNRPVINYRKP